MTARAAYFQAEVRGDLKSHEGSAHKGQKKGIEGEGEGVMFFTLLDWFGVAVPSRLEYRT